MGGWGRWGVGVGCQSGCEQRIAVFVGSGWVVRVDVNEELKFFRKFKKKLVGLGGGGRWGGGGSGEGSGWM